jgi:hypothetical protein
MERPVRTGRRAAGAGLDALGHQLAADVLGGQVGGRRPSATASGPVRPSPLQPRGLKAVRTPSARTSGVVGSRTHTRGTPGRPVGRRVPAPGPTDVGGDRLRQLLLCTPTGIVRRCRPGGRAAKACLDILRGAQPPQGGPCGNASMDGCSTAGSRPRWSACRGARSWPTAESGEAFAGKPCPRSAARGGRPGRLGLAL